MTVYPVLHFKFIRNSVTKDIQLCIIIIIEFKYLQTYFASGPGRAGPWKSGPFRALVFYQSFYFITCKHSKCHTSNASFKKKSRIRGNSIYYSNSSVIIQSNPHIRSIDVCVHIPTNEQDPHSLHHDRWWVIITTCSRFSRAFSISYNSQTCCWACHSLVSSTVIWRHVLILLSPTFFSTTTEMKW